MNYPEYDYDIKAEIAKNQDECANLCAATKGGLFWTYKDETKWCIVKTAVSEKVFDPRYVSGNRACGLTGK